MKSIVFLFSIIAIPINISAQLSHSKEVDLKKSLNLMVDGNPPIPGLSMVVIKSDEIVFEHYAGHSDLENRTAVSETTLFRLASLSKVYTIAAIARLYQDGKLGLDDPVKKYIPEFSSREVTIRMLCTHTGGIRHYRKKDSLNDLRHYDSTADALKIFVKDSLVNNPGTEYQYSSFGFVLLQAIIEQVSGLDYQVYLNDILEPIGIKSLNVDEKDKIIKHRTEFYSVSGGKLRNADFDDPSYKYGSGGMLSNARDLAKFGNAHMTDDVLSSITLEDIFKVQTYKNGDTVELRNDWKQCLGWRKDVSNEQLGEIFHHSGNMNGARTTLQIYPKHRMVIAFLGNLSSHPHSVELLGKGLARYILRPDGSKARDSITSVNIFEPGTKTSIGEIEITDSRPIKRFSLAIPSLFEEQVNGNLLWTGTEKGFELNSISVMWPAISRIELKSSDDESFLKVAYWDSNYELQELTFDITPN